MVLYACGADGCHYNAPTRQQLVRHQGSCPVRREAARARKSRLLGRRSRGEQHERDSNPASPAGAPPSPAGGAQEEAVYAASGDVGNFVDDAALEVADEGADPFTASGPAAAAVPAAGAGLEVADEQHSPIQQGAAHASAVARATAVGLDYSSARLAAWAQEANSGRGLPDSDVNTLLSLLREPDFSITSLEFRNARQLKAFQDQVAFGVGFGGSEFEEIILTQPGDDQDVILRMRDPLKVLEALLAHPQLKGGRLTTLAQPQYTSVGEQAERAYCHPMDCDKAVQLQLRVGDHVVVLMLQFYSDKTRLVSSASGASAWPFILTILNVSDHDKQVLLEDGLVAYLPNFKRPASMSDEQYLTRRLAILHACLQRIFAVFKQATAKRQPLRLKDADGAFRWFYPILASYTCDQPESRDVTGLRQGVLCAQPCVMCTCSREQLWDPDCRAPLRTEASMQAVLQQARQLRQQDGRTAAAALLQQHSIRSFVRPAVWGWEMSGNVYQCIGGDVLHSDDIDGPFGLLVSLLPRWAHDTFGAAEGAALVQLANQRLLDANGGCAGPFRIPAVEDGYIGTSARVSAQEHRNVMQEMPMAVRGVFVTRAAGLQDDPVATAFTMWWQYYSHKHRRLCEPFHTNASLTTMQTLWTRFIVYVRRHFGEHCSFNTTKCHAQTHAAELIKQLGVPLHLSTNFFEASHKTTSKRPYAASNKKKKQASKQMAKSYSRMLGMRNLNTAVLGTRTRGVSKRANRTMHSALKDGARAVLSTRRDRVVMAALTAAIQQPPGGPNTTLQQVVDAVPEARWLKTALLGYFRKAIVAIKVAHTATVAAEMPWAPSPTAAAAVSVVHHKLHATPQWHGQAVYDDVLVQMDDGSSLYAKLLLLFRANKEDVVFVRWYRQLHTRDPVLQCTRVTWAFGGDRQPLCDVVPLASILRRVVLTKDHVLANLGNVRVDADSVYHVNRFRWTGIA